MGINERIKAVRKHEDVNLTQRKFGERLGVKDNAISRIESGENGATEQMILAICREFGVSEDWLRTGEGGEEAMFDYDDSSIATVVRDWGLDETSQAVLSAYVKLNHEQREGANKFIYALSRSVLDRNIGQARAGVLEVMSEVIGNRQVPDSVKRGIDWKAAIAFDKAFPYVGIGNITADELAALTEYPVVSPSIADTAIGNIASVKTAASSDDSRPNDGGKAPMPDKARGVSDIGDKA